MPAPYQFINNSIINITAPTNYIKLGESMKTAWDDRKFLVFRNGYLISKQTYNFIIPSPYNNYKEKVFYSTITFQPGDRIEIFYIENEQNFANVPFNRESRICSYIYYAKTNDQELIKVPYPNSSYRRGKDAFLLFDDTGHHLDCRYDYTVSVDGRYVTLADHAKLKIMMKNYVVFTFCYTENRSINLQEEEMDKDDTTFLAEIEYKYSYSIEKVTNSQTDVKFSPPFADWPNMIEKNFMLFGNSVFIDPLRYEVIANDTLRFVDPEDAKVANYRRYTMCIPVKIIHPEMTALNEFRYEIVRLTATEAMQQEFILKPPDIMTENGGWYPHLVFRGSRLMDVQEEYRYDEVTNILTITDSSCFVKKGRELTVVYLDKQWTDMEKDIKYIICQFKMNPTGRRTQIPTYLYKNPSIKFNSSNLLLFVNGVFMEPERWSIEQPGNWIKLHPIEEKSYEDPAYDKTFTAVYLLQVVNPDIGTTIVKGPNGQKEIDPTEDNDELRFDEMYAKVKKKT